MGAQLTSLALNGNEYLWQGDPAFGASTRPSCSLLWARCATTRQRLRPAPAMPRHGLARIVEHKLVEARGRLLGNAEITDTPESLKAFPFHFKLNMTYALTGDATLTQTFAVTNTGDVELPFSVGGHPAFNVPAPGAEDEAFEDYELAFTEAWTNEAPIITPDGLMTFEDSYKAPDNSDVLPITHRSFDNDAIMFTDTPGSTLTLRGRKSGHGVKIDVEGFKYIGVWSAANDAPFVALEPWTGHTTMDTEDDVFEHKVNTITLAPGAT
ncbi:MAG: aldose 1-epimerase family protein, partial [Collinsella sp.]